MCKWVAPCHHETQSKILNPRVHPHRERGITGDRPEESQENSTVQITGNNFLNRESNKDMLCKIFVWIVAF